jgi:hypothetical protein
MLAFAGPALESYLRGRLVEGARQMAIGRPLPGGRPGLEFRRYPLACFLNGPLDNAAERVHAVAGGRWAPGRRGAWAWRQGEGMTRQRFLE